MTPRPDREAGFTLIELMIAMALFGLIAVAGLAMVDSVLGIQNQTSGRLERLADLRRAVYLVGVDLTQVDSGPIAGGGDTISFRRHGYAGAGLPVPVRYALAQGTLSRSVSNGGPQHLLTGIAAARWRFHAATTGWTDVWPPDPAAAQAWPDAVELSLVIAPARGRPSGTLRKLVRLPARPIQTQTP